MEVVAFHQAFACRIDEGVVAGASRAARGELIDVQLVEQSSDAVVDVQGAVVCMEADDLGKEAWMSGNASMCFAT